MSSARRSERFDTRIDAIQGEIRRPSGASRACRAASTSRRRSCSRCATGSRRRATAWSGSAASSPRRGRVLAARLVEIYKADSPDALTVILSADGFGDLLERAEFLDRISDQDREITDRVRGLRDTARDQAVQLRDLEQQEQVAAERILRERDQTSPRAVGPASRCRLRRR